MRNGNGFSADDFNRTEPGRVKPKSAAKDKLPAPSRATVGNLKRLRQIQSIDWPHIDKETKTPRANSQRNATALFDACDVEFRRNSFTEDTEIAWPDGTISPISDEIVSGLVLVADRCRCKFSDKRLGMIAEDLGRANTYHPIIDYLDSVAWDGKSRIDTWLIDYCAAENNRLNRTFGANTLLAAVHRVLEPGYKHDACLVLEGAQGAGKSTAVQILAGAEHFTDCLTVSMDAKTVIESTHGIWIAELPELSGMRKADREHVKVMLSRQVDRARLAFGRYSVSRPRQFIMLATTNDDQYLADPTGNRRFWPVKVGSIDEAQLATDRDQLWAEAYHRALAGESADLPRELWETASQVQAARLAEHPWQSTLASRLDGLNGAITQDQVWVVLSIKADRQDGNKGRQLRSVMQALGWKPIRKMLKGQRVNAYSNQQRGEKPSWLNLSDL
jgi:predicted P-loop ATPase